MAQNKQSWAKALSDAISMTTSIAAAFFAGIYGGMWLDSRFGTGRIFIIVGFILAILTSSKIMWERLMVENKRSDFRGQNSSDEGDEK